MVQSDFQASIRAKAVRLSGGQFRFVVEALPVGRLGRGLPGPRSRGSHRYSRDRHRRDPLAAREPVPHARLPDRPDAQALAVDRPAPTREKPHVGGGQLVLAVGPGHPLDGDPTARAIDAPHRVEEEDAQAPQRDELEAAQRQRSYTALAWPQLAHRGRLRRCGAISTVSARPAICSSSCTVP